MRRTTLLERILLLGGALLLFIPGHIWDFAASASSSSSTVCNATTVPPDSRQTA